MTEPKWILNSVATLRQLADLIEKGDLDVDTCSLRTSMRKDEMLDQPYQVILTVTFRESTP